MIYNLNWFEFFSSSLLIMIAWGFMAFSFYAWGDILTRLLEINITSLKKHISKIWLGWVFALLIFSFYHLFFPINAFASGLFYFSGIIYFFIKFGKKTIPFLKQIGTKKLIYLFLVLFSAAIIAIQLPINYDTGLYHLNSIRWVNEHHIIKGIGNIHVRLGLNQLFFVYAASLNFHPYLNDFAFHASNSFLFAIFAASLIFSGTAIDLLLLCLFFYIPMPYYWIANPTPDIASTLLQITAFWLFIEVIYSKSQINDKAHIISVVAILSAILVTVKLSNIIFALGLGFITLIYCCKHPFDKLGKKALTRSFIFITLFVVIWIVRGYIQTGYPAFPSDKGGIKFTWSVPKSLANYMENCVYCGSKTNGQIVDPKHPIFMDKWAWIDPWIKWNFFDENEYLSDDLVNDTITLIFLLLLPMIMFNWGIGSVNLLILGILFFIVWLRALFRQKGLFYKTNYLFYLLLVAVASICFWFIVAPEVRFANGIFIVFFITSLLLVKTAYPKMTLKPSLKNILMILPAILFIWGFMLQHSNNTFFIVGIKKLNKVPMKVFVTKSGLKLLVPTLSDQCWDSDLPSTPYPNSNLALIGTSIDDGFCIKE